MSGSPSASGLHDRNGVLQGRIAVVTGASRGIGRAVALALAGAGCAVAVNYRDNRTAAEDVVAAIQRAGGIAEAVAADVADPAAVETLFSTVKARFGSVEILVNNAGMTRDGLLMRMPVEDWDAVQGVNLRGAFLCCKAVIRSMMRQRWGRIINIASVVGLTGNAGQTNYAAAKAGLMGLTRAMAREVASRGITVNAVAPGLIDTDMTAQLNQAQREAALRQIPLERFGSVDEIASAVVFLASPAAAYITGQVLTIDGGMVMA